MHLSIFLSQIIGCYLVITSLAILIHQVRFKKIVHECLTNAPFIALSGALCLIFGLLIIVPHNFWIARWPVVVTIIGWVFIARAILQLFFPGIYIKLTKATMEKKGFLLIYWVVFLIGAYLLWAGFTH